MPTIYVSPTGSDSNSGATVALSLRTITAARGLAAAGDTVLVSGDTNTPYNEQVTPKAGVTFKGVPGARPCLDGGGTLTAAFYTQSAVNLTNMRIEGFEIRNYARAGIYISGTQGVNHDAVLHDNWIHHIFGPGTYENGIYLGFGNTTVTKNEISHIGQGGEAMGIWMWRNHNARIDGNLIYLCRKSCIREATGLSNTIVNNFLCAAWTGFEANVGVGALVANNVMAFCVNNAWLKHVNNTTNALPIWGLSVAPAKYRFWHNTCFRPWEASIVFGGAPQGGGMAGDFDVRNNIFVGGGDTAPNQSGQAVIAKSAQSYIYDSPTSRFGGEIVDFNCYATAATFNRPVNVYRDGSSTPYVTKELATLVTDFGWEINGADLDPQLIDPVNMNFDYLDTSPVKNMGAALPSAWGSQMGARGILPPRIKWQPHNLMGFSKTWAAGVWLGMVDQRSPSSSAWTMTPGVDQIILDLGSTKDITHLIQYPLAHNSTSNVKGHRWESSNSSSGPWTILIEGNYQDFEGSSFGEEIPGGGTQCRYLRFTFLSNFSPTGLTGLVGSTELSAANLTFGAAPPSGGGGDPPPPPPPAAPPPTVGAYIGMRA